MEFSEILQLVGMLCLFFVVLYLAYFVTKLVGKTQFRKSIGKNMSIVEVLQVGQQKTLQLIKVGNDFMIIGVTKDRITFVKSIDESMLSIDEYDEKTIPFKEFLDKLTHKDRQKVDSGRLGEKLNEHQEQ